MGASHGDPGSRSSGAGQVAGLTELELPAMSQFLTRFIREDEGQDLIEYAFLAAFIALVALVGVQVLGTAINTRMDNLATSVNN